MKNCYDKTLKTSLKNSTLREKYLHQMTLRKSDSVNKKNLYFQKKMGPGCKQFMISEM